MEHLSEHPVNLKYVTPTQSLDVIYEGQCRRFAVASVSTFNETQPNQIEDLAADLSRLKLTNPRQLWTVGWDTMVSIIDEKKDLPPPEKVAERRELQGHLLTTIVTDSYHTCGKAR